MSNKKVFLFFAGLIPATMLNAQGGVTIDPTQVAQNSTMIGQNASILTQAVETFKQMQSIYKQGEASYDQFVQIKGFISNAEYRLQNIGDIKQLRLNDLNSILGKVLCIKQGNYFPKQIQFMDIIAKIEAAFGNCSNQELYGYTYSGVLDNLEARFINAGTVGAAEANNRLNEFYTSLNTAQKTSEATNAYDARTKLELGLKYKGISDTLMYMSEELHLAINLDKGDNKNIALSPADRMKLMDLANEYQLKAVDYQQKSVELLKEASEADANQKEQIQRVKTDLATQEMINFQL